MRSAVVLGIASLLGCSEHHAIVVDGGAPDAGTTTPYVLCDRLERRVYALDVVPARFVEAIARFDEVTNPPPR